MAQHIVILGAGISGLATAWYLKYTLDSQADVTIIDKSPHPGGWIQTIHQEGFLFEQGPRSFRSKGGATTLALVEALGLENELTAPHISAQNRYIYDSQGLVRLPRHLWEIPFSRLTRGWWKALRNDWTNPKCHETDESIYAFFNRRLGKDWTERLIDPMILGIYAGDCKTLSLKSCFPQFHQWEQENGSLLRGGFSQRPLTENHSPFVKLRSRFPLFSFKSGMKTLIHALSLRLKESLRMNRKVERLVFHRNKIEIILDDGEKLIADRLISTLPTYALSSILSDHLVSSKLQELSYASVCVVNMGFRTSVLPLKGFGYLIPSRLETPVMGCVWDSCIFPEQNGGQDMTRLSVMIGGTLHPEVEQMSEQQMIEYALSALKQQMNVLVSPHVIQVAKAYRAIPQYEVGYQTWKSMIQNEISRLYPLLILSGCAFGGVSINDCISQARRLAHQLAMKAKEDFCTPNASRIR